MMKLSGKHCSVWRALLCVCVPWFGAIPLACHDSEVEYLAPVNTSTDSVPYIAGRDSAHKVPVDTGTVMDWASETGGDTQTEGSDTVQTELADTVTASDAAWDSDASSDSNTADGAPGTWTLMLYMSADSDLEESMLLDLQELSTVVLPDWLNIVILFDRREGLDTTDGDWKGTRLFRVNPAMESGLERLADATYMGLTAAGDNEERDLGDVRTLEQFIQYSKATFPAAHYGLVLSGHGNGWQKKGANFAPLAKVICSDDSGFTDGISVQNDLAPLLQMYPMDVLGFDACLMGMVEVAWAVKDSVKYMIASEANEASYGWDYEAWINEWANAIDHSALNLAKTQVVTYRRFHEEYHLKPWVMTMAVVDTAMLDALGEAINNLVATYTLADYVYQAMTFDDYYHDYYDLLHIAELTGDNTLKDAIDAAVIFRWNSEGGGVPGGLSIRFVEGVDTEYRQIAFCVDLDWC
ncbi:MAG: hypothetical protein JXR76_21170 [Deltaproteobacteria bacterium]|nr:hypothetical protein [Deltaproteobacteria bacterium]